MNQPNELYGSHLPFLSRIIDITSGPVLELGMGLYSSPFLHTICFLQNRELVSIDSDPQWYEENKKMESDLHKVIFVDDFDQYEVNRSNDFKESRHWSVAFVDHKPAKRRKEEIKRLAHCANFVVIHDTEPESDKFFKYSWVYKLYKYRFDYTALRPNTSVLSNFIDVERVLR
jgi:hypothetical protein